MIANPNQKVSELLSVMGVLNPVSQGAATVSTGWIDASKCAAFAALLMVGAMTATGTIDAKIEQATSSGGAGVKDVAGKAITQLTAAGVDSNKQVIINLRPDDLDAANNFRYFRLSVTVATAASLLSAVVLGAFHRYGPGSGQNLAAVKEIVG